MTQISLTLLKLGKSTLRGICLEGSKHLNMWLSFFPNTNESKLPMKLKCLVWFDFHTEKHQIEIWTSTSLPVIVVVEKQPMQWSKGNILTILDGKVSIISCWNCRWNWYILPECLDFIKLPFLARSNSSSGVGLGWTSNTSKIDWLPLIRKGVTNRTGKGRGRIFHGIRTRAGQEPRQGPRENHGMASCARGCAPWWDTLMQIYNRDNSGQLKSGGTKGYVMCSSKLMWKGRLQFGEGDESKAKGTSTFHGLSVSWKYSISCTVREMGCIIFFSSSVFNGEMDTSCFHSDFYKIWYGTTTSLKRHLETNKWKTWPKSL